MRIVLVYADAFAPGGYPRGVRWLGGALAAAGHEVVIIGRVGRCADGTGDAIGETDPEMWPARAKGADVVHAFGLSHVPQVKAVRAVRGKGKLFVLSPLAHMMREHVRVGAWKKRPAYALVGRVLTRRDDCVHFFSAQEEVEARPYVGSRRSFVAGLGLYPAENVRVEDSEDYLLFFGRNDVHQKGLDLLIAGYEKALTEGLELPLVIGGRAHGDSAAFLASALERPTLKGKLRVLGATSDEERARLMSSARTFVFLSRWDGPPRPVREALALGVPVIVSTGTNMGDGIEAHGAGAHVDGSPGSVAAALLRAADDGAVDRWRDGAKNLSATLSWERVAAEYLAGYEACSR